MTEKDKSRKIHTVSKTAKTRLSNETTIPQVWGKNPIFAATRLNEPREVVIADGTTWVMGVQPPFGETTNPEYLRGFDVRHAEVIFRLLAFFRDNDIDFYHKVDISYYRLLEIIGWERSKKSLAVLKDILADLSSIWTQIRALDINRGFRFRVLSASVDEALDRPESEHLKYIVFDPTFIEYMGNIEQFLSIRLDVFNGLSSKIAKAMYLYLPSRALKATNATPFKITLTKLFEQIGIKIPKYKSLRFKTINQSKNPVMKQLDHCLISFKEKLRVSLEDTSDDKDYNLCCWVEQLADRDISISRTDSLRSWFLTGKNGSAADFKLKLENLSELSIYEHNALEIANINLKRSMEFLLQSKALLGAGCFEELCGVLKDAVLTRDIKIPTGYLISLVKSQLLHELPLY
ncbi:MAG: replication initiation protein [Lentisphaerae bacterium]|nr:replication initiation protein [Lentisphaerota bacterium]